VTAFSDALRAEVAARAAHRCEYCHLPTRGQVATFPIDHVIPRSRGGPNDAGNLALTCPHCNAHKWTAVDGQDPDTGETVRFFHPRTDAWADHFAWSAADPGALAGRTPIGRATIAGLRLLAELGLFPEIVG
jgi:5-methylcytosine-specific restriction endonuclease McrA